MGWQTELDGYLEYLASEGRTKSYTKASRSVLGRLGRATEPDSFLDLTESDVRAWVAELRGDGLAKSSVHGYLARVRACLRWLNDGETPDSLRRITIRGSESRIKSEGDLLSDDELDAVLSHLSPFYRTVALVLRYTGARPGEILELRKKDLTWDNGRVRISIPETKTNRPRVVPLVEAKAVAALRAHMDHLPPETPWVFPAPRSEGPLKDPTLAYAMKQAADKASVDRDRVFPYMIRHMRASHLARQGVNQAVADQVMGWAPGSDQWANYTHFRTSDVETALASVDEVAEMESVETVKDRMIEALREIINDPELTAEFREAFMGE